jgi:twinkle protein
VSQQDGETPETVYRPSYSSVTNQLVGFSVKILETKQSWWVYHKTDLHLFGWLQAIKTGAKRLYITEGQEDAVALFQVLKEQNIGTQYEKYDPAVVSLNNGAGSAVKTLARLQKEIRANFKEIVLVFDNDKAGKEAANEVCKKVFPEAHVAELPAKDANACLMEGISKRLFAAVRFNSEKPKNTRIIWAEGLHEAAKKPAEFGVSWPWPSVTEATRGIRKGETTYFGAAPKMGKSEVVDSLGSWLIKEHGWKILMAKPEQANVQTYKRMAGKMVGKIFHDPKIRFDEAAYEEAGSLLKGNLALIDLYQHMGWDTLQLDIRAAAAEGIDAVFIDPITNLTNGVQSADANTKLQEVAQELSAMALDLNLHIFIMCHLKNPEGGLPHDRGGKVLSSQFAGSRAMARSCNYMFGLEGNKDPDLPEEQRNLRDLVLIEDREFGEACRTGLYWDRNTGWFNEVRV